MILAHGYQVWSSSIGFTRHHLILSHGLLSWFSITFYHPDFLSIVYVSSFIIVYCYHMLSLSSSVA